MRQNNFSAGPAIVREIRHFHLFCGLGGGAKGFNKASPRVGNMVGKFRCIGGIDVNAPAIRDFERLAGVKGTVLDLFDRSQFTDFHGVEPPLSWREASPDDIRRAAGYEYPHIVFLSAPCKGFSGLLAEGKSKTAKYQALNRLTVRGVWLMLEAFKEDPPELIVFENVPRIATRGRHLLDQIVSTLRAYGYAVAETTHDCGELGGLAQSRKRFLLVARHIEKVPPFLYEPEKKRLQSVGTILGRMPLPGNVAGGPMHRVPQLQWKTWVRLAFVEAGGDWRTLNRLQVEDGVLRDFLIVPEYRSGYLGVRQWEEPVGTVAGRSTPSNGAFSVADPRAPSGSLEYRQYGVVAWDDTMGSVINVKSPGQGTFSVADPRHHGPAKHCNEFRIVPWGSRACTVTGAHGTGQCVSDPCPPQGPLFSKYAVTPWGSKTGTVIGGDDSGAYAVADPRPAWEKRYGNLAVTEWNDASNTVIAGGKGVQGGWLSVADPRKLEKNETHPQAEASVTMPSASDKVVCRIQALDGTWHRPFTTLELAALQSLVDPEEYLELDGLADSDWRERIGNAVPPEAAQAIAGVMGVTLLLAWSGESFMLSATPIWVRPVAVALSVAQEGLHG